MKPDVALAVRGPAVSRADEVLTNDAFAFVAALEAKFGPTRATLLRARTERQLHLTAGQLPRFLPETEAVRTGAWRVAAPPKDLEDRRVEITGPVERKMMINAFNSGAQVFMADFEDANSPTWENIVTGHVNLRDFVNGELSYTSPEGKRYELRDEVATLMVRPRGWHLPERHLLFDGEAVSASLADFGLFLFHNGRELISRGSGPYFYLPKLEGHLEARLWNDVFAFSEARLGLAHGSVRATVLIETVLAAFEMDEILYELRERSAGLNAGRWDYLFSIIKKLGHRPDRVLPDRAQLTMAVPFMRAYTQLLVRTCHRRGAHAIGGMAAFIPSRKDPTVNVRALAKVREDKEREARDGFDGTWVAHPDLVPVARAVFDGVLGRRPNQLERTREDVVPSERALVALGVPGGSVTEGGLRTNVSVSIQYIGSWLTGVGAAGIANLMEDAATAEISRSQVWQWVRHGARLADGRTVTEGLVRATVREEMARLRAALGDARWAAGRFDEAQAVFEAVALSRDFVEFLTLPAYDALIRLEGRSSA